MKLTTILEASKAEYLELQQRLIDVLPDKANVVIGKIPVDIMNEFGFTEPTAVIIDGNKPHHVMVAPADPKIYGSDALFSITIRPDASSRVSVAPWDTSTRRFDKMVQLIKKVIARN